jgi:hypothetical protein
MEHKIGSGSRRKRVNQAQKIGCGAVLLATEMEALLLELLGGSTVSMKKKVTLSDIKLRGFEVYLARGSIWSLERIFATTPGPSAANAVPNASKTTETALHSRWSTGAI